MICIYCGSKTRVSNSRAQNKTNQTWRRRKCLGCQGVFTTVEQTDLATSLIYRKDSSHTEPFQRNKLLFSIYSACGHRKNASSDATALTVTIVSKLLPKVSTATLKRSDIINVATDVLKHFDKAAAVHYTAYHPL